MAALTTASGLPGVGELVWGSHFCHFYRNRDDLVDSLVPFFKSGLEGGEACLWITSEPFRAEDARAVLKQAVPDLDQRREAGQIQIIDYEEWYTRSGETDAEAVLAGWVSRAGRALEQGFAGLRLTGNTYWLEKKDWSGFVEYERRVNETFRHHRIIGLCSYCLSRCNQDEVLDVIRNHDFTLARRDGEWEHIESASLKLAKLELMQLAEELEQRVRERTAELEAALQTRDTFLSVASHELKTPVGSMQLYLDGLLRAADRGGLSPAMVTERLRKARAQCQRLDRLIGNLLDVSRTGDTGLQLDPETLDLAGLVRGVVEQMAEELRRAGNTVALEIDGPLMGRWDRLRLEQVVTNLLANALKYAPGTRVELSLRAAPDGALLRVRDHGPGLQPGERERIFDRFSRGSAGLRHGGFGLGLWIVREIVRAHGGEITAESAPGAGACFVVSLPTARH